MVMVIGDGSDEEISQKYHKKQSLVPYLTSENQQQ